MFFNWPGSGRVFLGSRISLKNSVGFGIRLLLEAGFVKIGHGMWDIDII